VIEALVSEFMLADSQNVERASRLAAAMAAWLANQG